MFKRVTYKFLLCLSIILPVLYINYFIDIFGMFKNNKNEKDIAEYLIMGRLVSDLEYYNDRMIQKHLIFNKTIKDELIVLGSSKTMTLNKDIFPDFSFFNYSVSRANLEDILAIYEMLSESNKEPNIVIVGVDPWFFNINNELDKKWESIGSYYCNFINRLQESKAIPDDYSCLINPEIFHTLKAHTRLLSLEYFQITLMILVDYNRQKNQFKISQDLDSINALITIKLPDGSLSYGFGFEKRSIIEVNSNVTTWINSNIPDLNNFYTIDKKKWNLFTSSLLFLKNRGIKVIISLTPYHPIAYNFFKNNIKYQTVMDVENRVRAWSKDNSIPIIGSYDPTICGYDNSDFYDATHPRKNSIERYLKAVLDSTNYFR